MKNKRIIIFVIGCLLLTGCKDKTYTITFDTNGGIPYDNVVVKEGSTIENLKEPTKDGYLFVSWRSGGIEFNQETPITKDLKLTAKWIEKPQIANIYTITFVVDDKIEQTKVLENDTIKEPKIPKKENYLFLGWYLDNKLYDFNTPIIKDITLIAKYELNVVTVSYDLDGGVGLSLETIPKNSNLTIPEPPKKEGYRFLKWTLDDQDFSFEDKITKDIALKANWEKIEYVTITFDTDGGTIIEPKKIEKHSYLTNLPIPSKEGYSFVAWYSFNQPFDTEAKVETDLNFKAVYQKNIQQ